VEIPVGIAWKGGAQLLGPAATEPPVAALRISRPWPVTSRRHGRPARRW